MNTPVAFLIFNRPDTTKKVFEVIQQVKPLKLLVVADGPRAERVGEKEKCAAARAVIEQVDWKCEILTNYSDINLGCKQRVSSGLDWVFEKVEEAIILEDDCLPHPSFFHFCEELLKHYKFDTRVMTISGNNFQFGRKRTEYSYYFSRYNHCWGWATWQRAWQHFDSDMQLWSQIKKDHWLKDILGDSQAEEYWQKQFESTYNGLINSWAYRWTFACWIQNGLSILPNVNLVSNIGFSSEGTNTLKPNKFANIPSLAMLFPIQHPPFVIRDSESDAFTQKAHFSSMKTLSFVKNNLKKLVLNQTF